MGGAKGALYICCNWNKEKGYYQAVFDWLVWYGSVPAVHVDSGIQLANRRNRSVKL
ncbi:hypothetical protein NEUTE2DRAFT_119347, partial [Neurospora tetrasperma FGSC 2509]